MDSLLRQKALNLLVEAREAADPKTGGLLGRSDLEDLVLRLGELTEQLLETFDEIEGSDSLLTHLKRAGSPMATPSTALMLHG